MSQYQSRPCRYCRIRKAVKRRGLCVPCYANKAIRQMVGCLNRRRDRLRWFVDRPWPAPTLAAPGTPDKIRVLAERLARGERLFHPRDYLTKGVVPC